TASSNVTAGAGCSWTTSGPTWITFSPASGTGSSSVTLTASANTGVTRSGTVTIAGSSYTVTQSGASGGTGFSLSLPGTVNDYANSGKSSSLNIAGAITVEAWINPSAVGTNRQMILDWVGGTSGAEYALQLMPNGNTVRFGVWQSAVSSQT